jgi:hypothetical protein
MRIVYFDHYGLLQEGAKRTRVWSKLTPVTEVIATSVSPGAPTDQ